MKKLLFIIVSFTLYTSKIFAQDIHSSNNTPHPMTSGCGILTDVRDGKHYQTVTIGTQCWMAENLNFGTQVSDVTVETNDGITEKACYNDTSSNCNTYGGFYTWDEAMNYATLPQGICPSGWHIPSVTEWEVLINYLGIATAGTKMKATSTDSITWDGTNTSGFSAIPGGIGQGVSYLFKGNRNTFWSSTQYNATDAYDYGLTSGVATLDSTHNTKPSGYCIRCLSSSLTGINENKTEELNIFPSPSSGAFTINIGSAESYHLITIYNATGQLVFENKIGTEKIYPINLTDQPNGIYFIRLEGEKNSVIKKVLIQKQ
jgi:uncharacterized protein (TIGR02145 family)